MILPVTQRILGAMLGSRTTLSGVYVMSEDQKTREETQPMAKEAPTAASGNKDTKEKPVEQHSFHDWASI